MDFEGQGALRQPASQRSGRALHGQTPLAQFAHCSTYLESLNNLQAYLLLSLRLMGQSPWAQADLRAEIAALAKVQSEMSSWQNKMQEERHATLLAAIRNAPPSESGQTPRETGRANPGSDPSAAGHGSEFPPQGSSSPADAAAVDQRGGIGLKFKVRRRRE